MSRGVYEVSMRWGVCELGWVSSHRRLVALGQ